MTHPSYEELRDSITAISRPDARGERTMLWVIPRLLGVGVSRRGSYEIFVVGQQLVALSPLIRRHLEYDAWWTQEDQALFANRIVLPSAPHFATMSALILIELLSRRVDAGDDHLRKSFREIEPLIDLALRKTALSTESTIGLIGELLVLEQLLSATADAPDRAAEVLAFWRGYARVARDFSIGSTAIEVKTTRAACSTHFIHSLTQVEPLGDPAHPEDRVLLLSCGVRFDDEGGVTLPQLVARIAAALGDQVSADGERLAERLYNQIRAYGADGETGYDHTAMKEWGVYQDGFELSFEPRLYDVGDPDVRLLRRSNLEGTHVNPDRIEYEVNLPARVNQLNPHRSWLTALSGLARAQLGLSSIG